MKILITGGNGFIAKNLFEQLQNKYSVTSLTRQELDLTDSEKVFEYLKENYFDVVIHTATYDAVARFSTKDLSKVLETNLQMFFNIERCKKYFGKMIYFGSGAEFSRPYWIPKMREDYFDQHIPSDPYGFSKYIMTKYTLFNNNIYNLRIFGVFGKYDDWRTRFIENAICNAVFDRPIKMRQNRFFDHIYIDDLVKIVDWFLRNDPLKKVYNVCSGAVYDFFTLAGIIIKTSGKYLDIVVDKEDLGTEYSGDNTLLLNELKDFEFTPIEDSLQEIYNWYDENKHLIDVNQL